LSLDLSTSTVTIDSTNTKIWYGESVCRITDVSNLSALTCVLDDGVVAGSNKPKILVDLKGYALYSGAA